MMNILLVEPDYHNKYPPLGLMKISAYHKQKGDRVIFVKGKSKDASCCFWDRIYITTLFTFDYEIVVDTIRHYKKFVNHVDDIYVGGILASLMPHELLADSGITNVVVGQLTTSNMLGFDDDINIDCLVLDYDILDDIEYKYPAGDNYIAYTTRGCPNRCSFCAVPRLEPIFKTQNHIGELIRSVDTEYGAKRNLLLLDNNVLNSPEFSLIIEEIKKAGFSKGSVYFEPNLFDLLLSKVYRYPGEKKHLDKLIAYLKDYKRLVPLKRKRAEYICLLDKLRDTDDPLRVIQENKEQFSSSLEKYKDKRPKLRYVDFNQGIDARLLDEKKMELLAQIPIHPLRVAFDSFAYKENYCEVIRLAAKFGIKDVSNYLLYNFTDRPEELWERLKVNVDLREELHIEIFSFPMKYMPIDRTTRDFVGKHWRRKYLTAVTAVLLVTKGIVAHGGSFFGKAFGKNVNEFFEILSMPRDFIIYRKEFEEAGLTDEWKESFYSLTKDEKDQLFDLVENNEHQKFPVLGVNRKINKALSYYGISRKKLGNSRQLTIDFEPAD